MKKLICLLMCLLMIFSFVACTEDGEGDGATTTTTTQPSTTTTTAGANLNPGKDYSGMLPTENVHYVYVSSKTGVDSNDGSAPDKAFATLEYATSAVLDYINGGGEDDVIVAMADGDYYVANGFNLPVTAGKSNKIYYATVGGGRARILGGMNIGQSKITYANESHVVGKENKKVLDLVSPEIAPHLLAVDVSEFSDVLTSIFNDAGVPKATSGSSTISSYDAVEFYNGNSNLQPARFPNHGEYSADAEAFGYDLAGWLFTTYINYEYTDRNGNTEWYTPTEMRALGLYRTAPMNIWVTNETYETIYDWDFKNQEGLLFNFFGNSWDDLIHQITDFVTYDQTEYPNGFNPGGNGRYFAYFKTDRGRNYNGELGGDDTTTGNPTYRTYYIMNVLEAIDIPGEYYYDHASKMLYVYLGENADTSDLYVATSQSDLVIGNGSNNITFLGIDIMYCQNNLVKLTNCQNVTFKGCTIAHCADKAIVADNTPGLTVDSCHIFELGMGAIDLRNTCKPDSSKKLEMADILIQNCDIHDIASRHYSYSWAIYFTRVCGITIRQNSVHHGKHGAFSWDDAAFLTFEYNDIYEFIRETDDVGLFYQHSDNATQVGTVVRYNKIHDIGINYPNWNSNIFYDDGYGSGYEIHHNLIYNLWEGEFAKATVFCKMKAEYVHDNFIFNTGERVTMSSGDKDYGNFSWWRDVNSSFTVKADAIWSHIQNSGIGGAWEANFEDPDMDGRFQYDMLRYLNSEESFYDVYGNGIAVSNDLIKNDGGATVIRDDNAKYITVTLNKTLDGQYEGKNLTAGSKFTGWTSIAKLADFLYEYGQIKSSTQVNPAACSITYYDPDTMAVAVNIHAFYMPLYTYNESTYEWEYSKWSVSSGNNTDAWTQAHEMMGRHYYWADGYHGVYHNNISINTYNNFSTDKSVWDAVHVKAYNYYDGMMDVELFEDGEYSSDIVDYLEDLSYQEGYEWVADFELLDLSKVGCKLG